jgi:allantoin racemase
MTRLLLLAPADLDLSRQIEAASDSANRDTQIVHRAVPLPSVPPLGAHDWALADLAIMAAGQNAAAEGFDAVCLADCGDYGVGALRSLLDIPVMTAGRSAMLHALTLGGSFTILAAARDYNRARKLVHDYGLRAQCAGILTEDTADAARTAEVVIMADPMLVPAKLAPQTAVIQPVPLLVKLTESLVSANLTHSRRAFPAPDVRKAALIDSLAAAALGS